MNNNKDCRVGQITLSRQSPLFWLSEHNGKMMWLLELQTKNFLLLTHGPIVIYFFQLQGNTGAKMLDLTLFFQNYSFLSELKNSVDILCKMCQRCDLALDRNFTRSSALGAKLYNKFKLFGKNVKILGCLVIKQKCLKF